MATFEGSAGSETINGSDDADTIRAADQILVLNHGRLQERGRHDELMAVEGGLYRRLVELQTLEEAGPDADSSRHHQAHLRWPASSSSTALFGAGRPKR